MSEPYAITLNKPGHHNEILGSSCYMGLITSATVGK